ncbi:MAG: hypothetical protein GX864_03490 [Mollicutes bacterium]|jgi:hypothetical protein|nr:hypothetical protein [Mollicutes bacterium]
MDDLKSVLLNEGYIDEYIDFILIYHTIYGERLQINVDRIYDRWRYGV